MEVEPFDTVGSAKTKIEEKKGIPSNQQQLMFSGMQLKDSCPLSDYNIQNEATVDLVLNLRILLKLGCCDT